MFSRAFCLLLLILAALVILVRGRGDIRHVTVELPLRLMPGQPLPRDARCYGEYWSSEFLYCQADGAYIALKRGVIERTTLTVSHLAIGDLILAWGTPTGEERYGNSAYVYWGNRSVWAWAVGQFSPETEVLFVTWTQEPDVTEPWRGFVSK